MIEYQSCDDEFLLNLINSGNRAAYAEIYNRYKGILYVHACRMLKDTEEAEDVIHDLFVAIWNKRDTLIIEKELRFYLYSSLRNRIFKKLARKKLGDNYIASLSDYVADINSDTDHLVSVKLLSALIEKEIDALPAKMREVFQLSRKANLSHKEIAEKLDISEQTVRKHIQHALRILRLKIRMMVLLLF